MAQTIEAGETTDGNARNIESAITPTHIMYALHLLAPFTMLTLAVVALVIGIVKRDDVQGTWLESHYRWLAATFWWGLLWAVLAWGIFWIIGLITLGIAMLVLWVLPAAVVIWYLYRVIRGWLALNDRKAIGS